jgi:hypothetical protein
MQDLWPESFEVSDIRAPIAILKEQAVLLGKKTSNIIEGNVRDYDLPFSRSRNELTFAFYIIAPVMQYSYELLVAFYPIDFYPLKIKVPTDIFEELSQ